MKPEVIRVKPLPVYLERLQGAPHSAVTDYHIANKDQPAYGEEVATAIAKLVSTKHLSNSVARLESRLNWTIE
jgi:hypothetical protein